LNQRIFFGLVFRHDVQHAPCRYECLHFISPYLYPLIYIPLCEHKSLTS
jgi:hypothetical protein